MSVIKRKQTDEEGEEESELNGRNCPKFSRR